MLSIATLLAILVILVTFSVKVVKEDHRLVVFRFGRFFKVLGPAIVFLIPFVDRGVDVGLTESMPNWQGLTKNELDEKVKSIVLGKGYSVR